MRVAAGRSRQIALRRVCGGPAVVAGERLARVEDLDGVHGRPEAVEGLAAEVVPAVPAEGMRHDDHSALLPDPRDRLLAGQVAGDLPIEEAADELAVTRADLLPHDDSETVGHLAQPQRARDRVVVGRADDVDAGRTDRPRL